MRVGCGDVGKKVTNFDHLEVGASAVAAIETVSCHRSAGGHAVCRHCLRSPCRLPSLPLKPSPSSVAASEAFTLYRRCLRSPRRLPSLPLKPSPSLVAACEAIAAVRCCRLLYPSALYIGHPVELRSVREVVELYKSEKSFVVEVHRALSGLHSTTLIALER
ncbi:hypothetical protein Scep_024084 [Stephania cephalantha]|uniref:Uncharacterized protein n=1 Tax=Stephania cephalantha TaxID=152367 RepID=A0AAP0EWJ2_9MAGN